MDVEVLRGRLHEYINAADEQHLSAIYILVEDKIPGANEGIYTEDVMNMLYRRREDHRRGLSKSYSAEESLNIIKAYKK